MEYPGTKLNKPIRRLIFFTFIGLFLLISPIVILYTSGYRYDFKNGLLRETGSINIDVLPKTAEVYLNDTKLKSNFPIRLNNLVPGKFLLTIKNPGYYNWSKNIEIKNKETVYIKDVVMIKKSNPSLIQEGKIEELALSTDNKYLIYSLKKNGYKEVWQKNIKNEESFLIDKFSEDTSLNIAFSGNENFYSIDTVQNPYQKIIIVNLQNPKKTVDLTNYVKKPITKYQWKNGVTSEIYYSTDEKLTLFYPETNNQIPIIKNNFNDWYFENNRLWIIKINSSTKKTELIKDYLGFNQIFCEDLETEPENLQILTIRNNLVLLKKRNQTEMLLFTSDKKYSLAGEKYLISKYNNWLIIWSSWEVWTKTQNENPILLTRSGLQLQQIVPLDKNNTLALIWENNTTAFFPYYLVSHNLISQKVNALVADNDARIIYFSGNYNNTEGLWKLEY